MTFYLIAGSIALFGRFSDNTWPTLVFDIDCAGSEDSLLQCPHSSQGSSCGENRDSSVVCQSMQSGLELCTYLVIIMITIPIPVVGSLYSNCTDGTVRLAGGVSENEGRVEVCYGHSWGTVCDNGWSRHDANIVCRQLGYQPFGTNQLSS